MHARKADGEIEVWIHPFLTSSRDGDEWPVSGVGRFDIRGKVPDTSLIGGWVYPRAGVDVLEETNILPLSGIEALLLGCAARDPITRTTTISCIE